MPGLSTARFVQFGPPIGIKPMWGDKMGKRGLFWCGILTVVATPLLAQSHAEPKPKSQVNPTTGVATVSATGCIARWSPEAGDTAAKPPDGVEFVLTQVEGRTASATAAGSAMAEKTSAAARYLLLPQPSINLAAHLNHRVRIDGSIAPQPTQGATLADHLANPSARETNLPEGPEPKSYRENLIDVTSLTMVARSCSE